MKKMIQRVVNLSAAFCLALSTFTALLPAQVANAASVIDITNVSELCDAINNQSDGQTWKIEAGEYALAPCYTQSLEGQTGWYFPITADNLTIKGVGRPTIYGTGFTANGNWATQNLISVFGDNVKISGLTLMPKVEPNKTIEVLGSDFTLQNTTIEPNTLVDPAEYDGIANVQDRNDEKDWGGSIYFSHSGDHTLKNVTVKNGGISFRYAPTGTHLDFQNVKLDYATNIDWINGYRYSTGFNNAGNTITDMPKVTYHVSNSLDNLDSVLSNVKDSDQIVLNSNLKLSKQLTLNKAVTFDGNNHTIKPTFAKTDNSNNSALSIQSDNVTIKDLTVDGTKGTNLHGINIFDSNDVELSNVTAKNNDRTGVNVNGSTVTVTDITTEDNGWHGIDVDKPGAVLTINGTSHHTDTYQVYVDDSTVGQVIDTNNQYTSEDNVKVSGDRVYSLKTAVTTPTAEITTPHDGDTIHGTVTVNGTVSGLDLDTDIDFGFGWYSFAVLNEQGEIVVAPTSSLDWQWDTTQVADGHYRIVLAPTIVFIFLGSLISDLDDLGGLGGLIDSVNVTVDNSAVDPTDPVTPTTPETPSTNQPLPLAPFNNTSNDSTYVALNDSNDDTDVLGTSTKNTNNNGDTKSEVLGTSTDNKTWAILGLAWYWWLLILVVLAAVIQQLIRRLRQNNA